MVMPCAAACEKIWSNATVSDPDTTISGAPQLTDSVSTLFSATAFANTSRKPWSVLGAS